jgi:hypothetical protein
MYCVLVPGGMGPGQVSKDLKIVLRRKNIFSFRDRMDI